jgi:hypothetical protein
MMVLVLLAPLSQRKEPRLTPFEFAQIPIAIIVGVAMSEVLAGWGAQLRERTLRVVSLHFVATFWVLMIGARYLWIQWWAREVDFEFVDYLIAMLPAGAIALAAHVTRGGREVAGDREGDTYEAYRLPLCGAMVVFAATLILRATVSVVPDDGSYASIVIVNALWLAAFASMAASANRWLQRVGWAVVFGVGLVAAGALAGRLGAAS